jgi:hypothetical protein
MIKDYKNKQLLNTEKEKNIFNFPEYGVSIEAETYEKALQIIEIQNNKSNK